MSVRPVKQRLSLTAKGMATRATILDTSHQVFKETGYYGASISEITRRCGISMGNFYQYFKNKEQVFLELNDLIISRFSARVTSLPTQGLSFEERLQKAILLLYEHTRENFAFHRILGESELTDRVTLAYYETLAHHYRNFFRQESQEGNIRPLDPNLIAYGLIGVCYFHSFHWGKGERNPSPSKLVPLVADLFLNGISGPAPWKHLSRRALLAVPQSAFPPAGNGEPPTKGEATRQAIFRAAEKIFGQHGVNRANISEITREAGVAQGTFYVHFGSKRDLIDGFVKYINSMMRRELQRAVARTRDRRDVERVGILAFYDFLQRHREIYRVVPEFEMIDREVGLWYYNKVLQGYVQGLEQGIQRGEIRNLPTVFLARSLMGFIHFIGLKWIVWNKSPRPEVPPHHLEDMIELVLFGLKPR